VSSRQDVKPSQWARKLPSPELYSSWPDRSLLALKPSVAPSWVLPLPLTWLNGAFARAFDAPAPTIVSAATVAAAMVLTRMCSPRPLDRHRSAPPGPSGRPGHLVFDHTTHF